MKVHPAAEKFPQLEGAEFDALVADIREHGLREPIVLYEGAILDGRNRWRACEHLRIKPRTVEWDGEGTPEAFVISENIQRRHLSSSQRAFIISELATLSWGQTKTKLLAGETLNRDSGVLTIAEAASIAQVGATQMQAAKFVREHGPAEMHDEILAGELGVQEAERRIRKKPKKTKASQEPGFKSVRGYAFPKVPLETRMDRVLEQLDNTILILGECLSEDGARANDNLPSWNARLEKARTQLSRQINRNREGEQR